MDAARRTGAVVVRPFLKYQVIAVAAADGPLARRHSDARAAARAALDAPARRPAAVDGQIAADAALTWRPRSRGQRIFQSDAGRVGRSTTRRRCHAGDRLLGGRRIWPPATRAGWKGPGLAVSGEWCASTLPPAARQPAVSELLRFITTSAVHAGDDSRHRGRGDPLPAESPCDTVELALPSGLSARIRLAASHGPLCRLPLTKKVGVELRSITSASCASSWTRCSTLRRVHAHVGVEAVRCRQPAATA